MPTLRAPFTADHVCELVRRVHSGRIVFHEGDGEVAPGETVRALASSDTQLIPGHDPVVRTLFPRVGDDVYRLDVAPLKDPREIE